jgi:hypothetical protein
MTVVLNFGAAPTDDIPGITNLGPGTSIDTSTTAQLENMPRFDALIASNVLHHLVVDGKTGADVTTDVIRVLASKMNPNGIIIVRDEDLTTRQNYINSLMVHMAYTALEHKGLSLPALLRRASFFPLTREYVERQFRTFGLHTANSIVRSNKGVPQYTIVLQRGESVSEPVMYPDDVLFGRFVRNAVYSYCHHAGVKIDGYGDEAESISSGIGYAITHFNNSKDEPYGPDMLPAPTLDHTIEVDENQSVIHSLTPFVIRESNTDEKFYFSPVQLAFDVIPDDVEIVVEIFRAGPTFIHRGAVFFSPFAGNMIQFYRVRKGVLPSGAVKKSNIDEWMARRSSAVDLYQKRSLLQLFTVVADFTTIRPRPERCIVSLFSVSNAMNTKKSVLDLIRRSKRFIGIFPNKDVSEFIDLKNIQFQGETMTTVVNNRVYIDRLYQTSEFIGLGEVYSMSAFTLKTMMTPGGIPIGRASMPCVHRHALATESLPLESHGFQLLYGAKVEQRSIAELIKALSLGGVLILVDDKRLIDIDQFADIWDKMDRNAIYGVHALEGTDHNGAPFTARDTENWDARILVDEASNTIIYKHTTLLNAQYLASIKNLRDKQMTSLTGSDDVRLDFEGVCQSLRHSDVPWNGCNPLMELWFVVIKGFDVEYSHDVITSQTDGVKLYSIQLRYIFGLDDVSLHQLRKVALIKRYPNANLDTGEATIHGIVEGERISVAGHMVNLLLASHFTAVDFKRRMDDVVFNVEAVYEGRRLPSYDVLPGEPATDLHKLWHNFVEYEVALDSYIILAQMIDLQPNMVAVAYSRKVLLNLLNKFPKFRLGDSTKNMRIGR